MKVYVCAVKEGDIFRKVGVIAVPVGTYGNESFATSNVVMCA
jgi:hypothetical protein